MSCVPPPLERNRFLGIRINSDRDRIVVAFGRCDDEKVVGVTLGYADPPMEETPVLWRISSTGSHT
jgi:hypothetical protein